MNFRKIAAAVLAASLLYLAPAAAQVFTARQIVTAQVSCGTSATPLSAYNATRSSITITNLGTTAVYIGAAGVTSSNGMLLPGVVGSSISVPSVAAIFCVAGSAQAVSYIESW